MDTYVVLEDIDRWKLSDLIGVDGDLNSLACGVEARTLLEFGWESILLNISTWCSNISKCSELRERRRFGRAIDS